MVDLGGKWGQLYSFLVVFSFLIIVKGTVKCRSQLEPDDVMSISAMSGTEYWIVLVEFYIEIDKISPSR